MEAASEGRIRLRRPEDLPALADALWRQQPATGYPLRDPLPRPVEEFLHAHDARGAWVAEVDGQAAGHGCWIDPLRGFAAADAMNTAAASAHGCELDELAWVSALFVGVSARGGGLGRALLATVVEDIAAAGRYPCLEHLPIHPAAGALYDATGWRAVGTLRPAWLQEALGSDGPDVVVRVLPQ